MKKWLVGFIAILFVFSTLHFTTASERKDHGKPPKVKLGVEVLLDQHKDLLKGKRVGLVTNPTGVDHQLSSIVDLLAKDPDVNLTALYGPEHGVRGDAQAGANISSYIDSETGLPVYSLYGATKIPTAEMLQNVDVLLFDIQDVGTRFYTYISTLAYVLQGAKAQHIPVIVLDRPNPLGGDVVEGPVLDPAYSSFVGLYPIPLRHGMTMGELASFFNKEFDINADLTVMKMKGWKRSMNYDDTKLFFVPPSPNMPTLDTAYVYPGLGLIEGTNVSEGRGTTRPFETIGAPYINSTKLAAKLNALYLPGVTFRATSFIPTFSKHSGVLTHGVQIYVTDRKEFRAVETGLTVVKTIHDMYPNDFQFNSNLFFDKLIGNSWVRQDIENRASVKSIMNKWETETKQFEKARKQYLLYK